MPGYNPYGIPQNQADWFNLRPPPLTAAQKMHRKYGGTAPAENFIRQQRGEGAAHLGNVQPSWALPPRQMPFPPTSLFPTPQTPPTRRAPIAPQRQAPQQGFRPAINLPSPTTRGSAPFPNLPPGRLQ